MMWIVCWMSFLTIAIAIMGIGWFYMIRVVEILAKDKIKELEEKGKHLEQELLMEKLK